MLSLLPGSLCISVVSIAIASPPDMVSLLIGLMTWSAAHEERLGLNVEGLSLHGGSPPRWLAHSERPTPEKTIGQRPKSRFVQ